MKEFSPFKAPFMPLKGELYRDVAQNWGGICFWYLFAVVMVAFSLQTARASIDVGMAINQSRADIDKNLKDLPHLQVTGGKLTMKESSPYVYKVSNQPFIVFDTSGKFKTLPEAQDWLKSSVGPNDPPIVDEFPWALATENTLYMRGDGGEIRDVAWNQLSDMPMSPEIIKQLIDMGPMAYAITFLVCGLLFVFPTHLFAALIYGVVGLIMANASGAQLSFAACTRLAVIAMTPSILLSALVGVVAGGVFGALMPVFPILNLVSVPLTLGLLYYGCSRNSKHATQM